MAAGGWNAEFPLVFLIRGDSEHVILRAGVLSKLCRTVAVLVAVSAVVGRRAWNSRLSANVADTGMHDSTFYGLRLPLEILQQIRN